MGHRRHPIIRWLQIALGVLLLLLVPIVGPIPGPGGIFFFAGGLVLILRNSHWARVRWARIKRRWPRIGHASDRIMRRRSTLRRLALAKQRSN